MKLHLQHIGIVVKDIAAAMPAFELLGYRPAGPTVHDPVQTAHVQFLELSADTVRLELVCPDGPESKLANAARKGGGLNHLCYRTDDISQAISELRAAGMFELAAPTPAPAFEGRSIAWLMGRNGIPIELVEAPAETK